MLYPWLTNTWQTFTQLVQQDQLPHAILLTGPVGLGQEHLLTAMVKLLLCEHHVNQQSCGMCNSCGWLAQHYHPNWRELHPEKEDRIKIDDIRELLPFLQQTVNKQEYRVITLPNATRLNTAASNALLKILEEPPARVVFLLVAESPARLLPTIASRSVQFKLTQPTQQVALDWLNTQSTQPTDKLEFALHLSAGAPLAALHWLSDEKQAALQQVLDILMDKQSRKAITTASEQLATIEALSTLDILQCWLWLCREAIRLKLINKYNTISAARFSTDLTTHCNLVQLWQFTDTLQQTFAQIQAKLNLNTRLVFAKLTKDWYDLG